MKSDSPTKPRRRWWQFSLRLVLIVVTLAAIPLAYVAMKLRDAETQKQAVAVWVKRGATVEYSNRPRVPRWLGKWVLNLMGKDAFFLDSVSTREAYERRALLRSQIEVNRDRMGPAVKNDSDGGGSLLAQMARKVRAERAQRLAELKAELDGLPPLGDEHFAVLRNLDGIQSLQLIGSEITDATLARLTHLTELESLHLTETRVTDTGMKHVAHCGSLRNLGLEDTKITDAGLARLAKLTNLESLDLAGTQVTNAGLRHVRGMTRLKYFGPPGPLSDEGLACLENMTELTLIGDVGDVGDRVTDAGLRHLRKMTKLTALTITAPITGEGLVHLKPLSSLRILYLMRTDVNDKTAGHLKHLPKLQWLDLSQTLVTDAGLPQFRNFNGLTRLEFTEPLVSQLAAHNLNKAMPKCEVYSVPWPGPSDVECPHFYPSAFDRLVEMRTYADGSRGFHLAGEDVSADAVPLYLVHRPGPKDAHFTNLYLVQGLKDPRPTRLNRLLFGDELCKTVDFHLEAALGTDEIVLYDEKGRLAVANREEVLNRHGKKRGEQLLQLRAVWEELNERYSE